MVLGNLAMLHGVDPWEMTEWMWSSFIDGAEWVMLPNVIGMSQWADGGMMATKPYAAGGNYIDKMSDYCGELPLRPQATRRRRCLPVHHALLGLPRPAPRPTGEESAHRPPGPRFGAALRPACGSRTRRRGATLDSTTARCDVTDSRTADEPIFHLAMPDDWAAAFRPASTRCRPAGSRSSEEGFIHCSTRDQMQAHRQPVLRRPRPARAVDDRSAARAVARSCGNRRRPVSTSCSPTSTARCRSARSCATTSGSTHRRVRRRLDPSTTCSRLPRSVSDTDASRLTRTWCRGHP